MSTRVLGRCRHHGCRKCNTMGIYCIEHYQESIGKPLVRRPVEKPTVILGTAWTSRDAAQRVLPKSGSQRRRIYDAIRLAPDGLTRDELEVQLHIPCNSLNPRLRELAEDGWITDAGDTRPTRSGAPALVWRCA